MLICIFKLLYITLSRVITATILFLQCVLYSSSFVGTLKYEIPGDALQLCQLKIEHFSPGILKFNTKHEDNPFTLNCVAVPALFCLYFVQARVNWVLRIFGSQVTMTNRPVRSTFPDYLSVSYDYEKTNFTIQLILSWVGDVQAYLTTPSWSNQLVFVTFMDLKSYPKIQLHISTYLWDILV